ncbi:uncharacterized protein LOC128884337 isoform X2 [Hylaeus volcanicus]|uniref:uncharacterized protein LOC128884337 isoform X2 n=1 Tax=Hylaeus volcanicus TaxID=313075 RepID=UPI0023B7D50E|nr:uncharacterized protein LOC128884337 isoform X2 [Hylaeus volcanicus]
MTSLTLSNCVTPVKRKRGRPRLYPIPSSTVDPIFSSPVPEVSVNDVAAECREKVQSTTCQRDSVQRKPKKLKTKLKKKKPPSTLATLNPQILAVASYLKKPSIPEHHDLLRLFITYPTKSKLLLNGAYNKIPGLLPKHSSHKNSENPFLIPSLYVVNASQDNKLQTHSLHHEIFHVLGLFDAHTLSSKTTKTDLAFQKFDSLLDSILKHLNETLYSNIIQKKSNDKNKQTECSAIDKNVGQNMLTLLRNTKAIENLDVLQLSYEHQQEQKQEDILWNIWHPEFLLKIFVNNYVKEMDLPEPQLTNVLLESLRHQIHMKQSFYKVFIKISLLLMYHLTISSPLHLPFAQGYIMIDCSFSSLRLVDSVYWNIWNTFHELKTFVNDWILSINGPKEMFSTVLICFLREIYLQRLEFLKQNRETIIDCVRKYVSNFEEDTTITTNSDVDFHENPSILEERQRTLRSHHAYQFFDGETKEPGTLSNALFSNSNDSALHLTNTLLPLKTSNNLKEATYNANYAHSTTLPDQEISQGVRETSSTYLLQKIRQRFKPLILRTPCTTKLENHDILNILNHTLY